MRELDDLLAATTAIVKRLTGEPMLLSLCCRTNAADVVEQMIAGVPRHAFGYQRITVERT